LEFLDGFGIVHVAALLGINVSNTDDKRNVYPAIVKKSHLNREGFKLKRGKYEYNK
jgi:hypothetical protein